MVLLSHYMRLLLFALNRSSYPSTTHTTKPHKPDTLTTDYLVSLLRPTDELQIELSSFNNILLSCSRKRSHTKTSVGLNLEDNHTVLKTAWNEVQLKLSINPKTWVMFLSSSQITFLCNVETLMWNMMLAKESVHARVALVNWNLGKLFRQQFCGKNISFAV